MQAEREATASNSKQADEVNQTLASKQGIAS